MPCAKLPCRAFLITNHAPEQIVSGYDNITEEDHVIAVDNGLQRIHSLGLCPHAIIGDLDSVDANLLQNYSNVKCLKYPNEKNETDTELALQWCLQQNIYDEIIICNDLQGRFDHALAILQNLLLASGVKLRIESERQIVFLLPDNLEICNRKGQLLSIIPLTQEVRLLSSEGLKYSLNGLCLGQSQSRGISNEITASAAGICKADGEALVIITV